MKSRTRLLSGAVLTAGLLALCLGIVTSAEVSRSAAVFDRVVGLTSLPDLKSISRLPDLRRLLDRRTIRAAASAAQDPAPAATVKTDKADYHPFEIVKVSGAGWQPDETVEVIVKEDPWFADQDEITLYAVAEPDGTIFNDKFVTDFHDAGITFTLIATGKSSGLVATTTFTDAASASGDLDQCANADAGNPACAGGGTSWQNGNLNDNQADYLEGDSVPYRLKLSNLALTHPVTGTPLVHRVTIAWDTTKGNKHALDYITTYNRTVLLTDPCSEIPGDHCDATKEFDTENIPIDPRVTAGPDGTPGTGDDVVQIPGVFTLFGGTITAITFPPTVSPQPGAPPASPYAISTSNQCGNNNGTYANDSTTCVTVDFIANVTNPVLAWAGHIATRKDWGTNLSAIAISGSPFHTRFIDLDGSGGNQDRGLSAGAVFFPAALTIIKETNPSPDSTDFTFATTGADLPASFTLNTSAVGTTDRQAFSLTDATVRTVAEQGPPVGWTFTSLTCTVTADPLLGGSGGTATVSSQTATITPKEGDTIQCKYVNTKRPKLTVTKVLLPSTDSGLFNLKINGTTHVTDVGDGGSTGAQIANIGSNSFGETAGTGTSLSDYVTTISGTGCTDNGDGTGSITLAAGDDKTCTITNTRKGSIVIVKDAQPNDPENFKFTAGGGLSPALFFLDDDGDPTLSNTQTFSNLAPGSGYSVSESVPSGWTQASATCSDGSPISAIDVSAGETVTCTFVNTKKPKLTVVKVLAPASDSGKFNLQINGTTHASDVGNGGTTGAQDGIAGSNTFGETAGTGTSLSDYVTTISGTGCSDNGDGTGAITLAAGDSKTCTITNTRKGKIVVVKDAVPDGPTDFKFTAGGGLSPALFFLDDDTDGTLSNTQTFSGLAPGSTYSVAESVPDGWVQTSATCSDGSPISAIDVSAGETVTCTFVNTKNATVTVKKVMVGGTADFTFTGTPNGTISTSGGTINASVAPGTYYSTEVAVAGWDLTSIVCDDTDSTVNLGSLKATFKVAAGENVTCTFTNTKRGGIVVKKATIPSGATGSFTFTGKAAGTIGDGGEIAVPNLIPGTYYSTESNPTPAFDLTKIVCNDTDSSGDVSTRKATFVVAAGETVTCTFTNTQRGKAKVVKTVSGAPPSGTQAFTFQLRQGASAVASGTTLETVIANAANGGFLSFTTSLIPGQTYQLCEIVMPGWNTTLGEFVPGSFYPPDGVVPDPMVDNSILCVNFTVTAGETKTFTVNNTPPPGGRALTIGFWKNWASCAKSSGGQKPVLDQVLASFPINFFYVIPGSPTPATTHGIWIGRVFVDTCLEAVALLNKSTIVGLKKKASDPLFNMAAQLMAAVLNVQAGAGICPNNLLAIQNAHALLYKYSFNGTTYSPKLTAADANKANQLAAYLDAYNNTTACPAVPPPSAP